MRTYPRSKRAVAVLGATALATLLAGVTWGPPGALIAFLAFILLGTFVTIPDDLAPGEYDLFGLGVLVAVLVLGFGASALVHRQHVRYTNDMDVCGSAGCADSR